VSMGLSECGCAWTDPNHTSLSQLRRIHSTINRPNGRFIQLNEGRLLGQTGDTVTRGARGWRSNDSCPWFPCRSVRVKGLTSPSLLPSRTSLSGGHQICNCASTRCSTNFKLLRPRPSLPAVCRIRLELLILLTTRPYFLCRVLPPFGPTPGLIESAPGRTLETRLHR